MARERVTALRAEAATARRAPLPKIFNSLDKIRENHHGMARCAAVGASASQIAKLFAKDLYFVTGLFSDPMFCELIAHYRKTVKDA